MTICLLPLIPLMTNFEIPISDWGNHLWQIGYFGNYFQHHFSFPSTFNTSQMIGMPFPIFYGILFYPILSLISMATNANMAYRGVVILLVACQFLSAKLLVENITGKKKWALGLAALVVWAIYPLTLLYNGGAATEFVSGALLQCALSWLLCCAFNPSKYLKSVLPPLAILSLTIAAGTNPITAALGLIIFFALAVLVVPHPPYRKTFFLWIWGGSAFSLVVLSPWFFALSKFKDALLLVLKSHKVFIDPLFRDNFWTRIFPFPYDPRSWNITQAELHHVDMPFLEAQIHVPLLILTLILAALFISKKRQVPDKPNKRFELVAWLSLLFFGMILFLSTSPGLWATLPASFQVIQYPFRLITYCNFMLFISSVMFLKVLEECRILDTLNIKKILVIPLILGAMGVLLKDKHALFYLGDGLDHAKKWNTDKTRLIELPAGFYGYSDYTTPSLLPPLPNELNPINIQMPVSDEKNFGEVQTLSFDVRHDAQVAVDVQAFPWNHILVNGSSPPVLWTSNDGTQLIFPVTPGHYDVNYSFQPDSTWVALRNISLIVVFLAGAICALIRIVF